MRRRPIGTSVQQRRARVALARKYYATVRLKDDLAAALRSAEVELGRIVVEHEQLEVALRESEERFAILSQTTFEGIGLSDGGRVLAVNDQLANMLGYRPDELIGSEETQFVAPDARD